MTIPQKYLICPESKDRKDPHIYEKTTICKKCHFDPHEETVRDTHNLLLRLGFKEDEIHVPHRVEPIRDIFLSADGKRVNIQCKAARKIGKVYSRRNLKQLINTAIKSIKKKKCHAFIIILRGFELPPFYKRSKEIEKNRNRKIIYWDDNVFEYYKRSANSIGKPYAKYNLLSDLNLEIKIQKDPFRSRILSVKQSRKFTIYNFKIKPKDLLALGRVCRRATRDPKAYQRMMSPKRLKDMAEFLAKKDSLLLNNIIIAFEKRISSPDKKNKISIPPIYSSVWIVDGQHRLYGFNKYNSLKDDNKRKKLKNKFKNFDLVVTGISGAHKDIQAKIFREINEFHKKIQKSLLFDLYDYLEIDEPKTFLLNRIRAIKELNKYSKIFRNNIKILETDKSYTTLASFVDNEGIKELAKECNTTKSLQNNIDKFFNNIVTIFKDELDARQYITLQTKGIKTFLLLLYLIKKEGKNEKTCLKALRKRGLKIKTTFFEDKEYKGRGLGAGGPREVLKNMWLPAIRSEPGWKNFAKYFR